MVHEVADKTLGRWKGATNSRQAFGRVTEAAPKNGLQGRQHSRPGQSRARIDV